MGEMAFFYLPYFAHGGTIVKFDGVHGRFGTLLQICSSMMLVVLTKLLVLG
jgi:hypothetical protein